MRLSTRLCLLLGLFFVVGLVDVLADLVDQRRILTAEKETQLRNLVDAAYSVLQQNHDLAQRGDLTDSQARQNSIEAIRAMRYRGVEYFWIHDRTPDAPVMVMHPTVPELEGRRLDDPRFNRATAVSEGTGGSYRQLDDENLFVVMNRIIDAAGQGYVEYEWPRPLGEQSVSAEDFPKLSYVRLFAPWDWIIGTGIYVDDIETQFRRQARSKLAIAAIWLLLFGLVVWALAHGVLWPLRLLRREIERLRRDPDTPVNLPDYQGDEVGELALSFQTMMNERQKVKAALLDSIKQSRIAAHAFANMAEGVVVTDASARIISVNPAFERISGYSAVELIGSNPSILRSGKHSADFYNEMWNSLKEWGRWQGEIWNRSKDGRVFPEALSIVAARDDSGQLMNYIGVIADITERKTAESKIRFMAEHDTLTGLPNRVLLLDRLDQAIHKAARNRKRVALFFIDLDHFKYINDSLGHAAGDELLCQVAERITNGLRDSDTVARTGGDEFLVLLPDLASPDNAGRVTEAILETLARPMTLAGHEVTVTASIGIAIYPDDATDPLVLIQAADTAMYHSKESGRNAYHFFTQEMTARVFERMSLEHRLRQAIDKREFRLFYQPQVCLVTGRLEGFEALIRWQHPELGLIPPAKFIPVAEESGLILPIGRWVLHEAARQACEWNAAGLGPFKMAVNISAAQFRDAGFVAIVQTILDDTGLLPHLLELEMTESMMMSGVEQSISLLRELKRQRVLLSIDDFGTGYSSLSYLKRFPIDMIKIDQSFVRGVVDDLQDRAIVNAVIDLAKSLNMRTIAEGVESEEIREALRAMGCDQIQGYLFGRPAPADETVEMIRGWRSR